MCIWLQVDTYEIVFGQPNERNKPIVGQLNVVILFAKYCVYTCKKKDNNMSSFEFRIECHNQLKY